MGRGTKFVAFIKATHFPQALAMILVAAALSALYGQRGLALLFVVIATAAGQASIGWTNDFVDAKTDRALKRANKPSVSLALNPDSLRVPIVVALLLMPPFSILAAGWVGGLANILAILSAQVYNLYLSRTVWSWLPYAVSFSLLTVFAAQSNTLWPSWQVASIAACVGVIAHILNALPDMELDKRANLGGLVVSLGRTKSIVVAGVLLVLAIGLLAAVIFVS